MTLARVGEELGTSQAYALVRSGELRAIKVGGRGQWRVGRTDDLEAFIAGAYVDTRAFVVAHPHAVKSNPAVDVDADGEDGS